MRVIFANANVLHSRASRSLLPAEHLPAAIVCQIPRLISHKKSDRSRPGACLTGQHPLISPSSNKEFRRSRLKKASPSLNMAKPSDMSLIIKEKI